MNLEKLVPRCPTSSHRCTPIMTQRRALQTVILKMENYEKCWLHHCLCKVERTVNHLEYQLHRGNLLAVRLHCSPSIMVFSVLLGLSSQKDEANFFGFSKNDRGCLFCRRSILQKRVLRYPCIVRQTRIAANHSRGTRNSRGFFWTVRHSRAARCLRIMDFSSFREFTLFCGS